MAPSLSRRTKVSIALAFALSLLVAVFTPAPGSAFMTFAQATGQPCSTCHVNPNGGPQLNATGAAFAAIPTHNSDPAGAFAQVVGAVAPQPSSPISVSMAGVLGVNSVSYMISVRNSGAADISNVYVAGTIPAGTTFVSTDATPQGASFFSSQGGSAAWLIGTIPAGTSAGPFVYTVSMGTATDFSAAGFTHWLVPRDATASSPTIVPQ